MWKWLIAALALWAVPAAEAGVVAQMQHNGVVVRLTDEPCAHQDVVNLPYRSVWVEGGKSFEGCYTVHPQAGLVVAYYREDRSIALIPLTLFSRPVRL